MVGNFLGDQAARVLHIQMNYKYKRMIFFFLILEMVTFAKPTNQMPCYSTFMSWLGVADTYNVH